jgi:hypothetical protein
MTMDTSPSTHPNPVLAKLIDAAKQADLALDDLRFPITKKELSEAIKSAETTVFVSLPPDHVSYCGIAAHARLIAAAKDLLETIPTPSTDVGRRVFDELREAIWKCTPPF